MKIVTTNRKAGHDYHILETFEAGLVLRGSEVKSIRAGQVQLKDSFVMFKNNELWLLNSHISPLNQASYNNHVPERERKLLLGRREIDKVIDALKTQGLTMVPLKIYFKKGWAKIQVALVKGKKAYDKRDDVRKRDVKKQLAQVTRKSR